MASLHGLPGKPSPIRPGRPGHSAAVRDAAFLVYLGAGKRSVSRTSLLTGIGRQALTDWKRDDDWERRIADGFAGDGSAARSALAIARALFPTLLRVAADRHLAILADPSAHQPTQARLIELAYGMSGLVMPKASTVTVERDDDGRTRVSLTLSDLSQLSPSELAAFRDRGEVPDRYALPSGQDDDDADDGG